MKATVIGIGIIKKRNRITLEYPCLCCSDQFNSLVTKRSKMSAILVADTISEIMERMSSLHGFGDNITENIKHLLTAIQNKCSGSAKLDLSHSETKIWVGQITDLFYLVDDLCAEAALLSKQRKMMPLFSGCNLKPLLKLKPIEKWLVREVAPMKNVKMLPNWDAGEEEAESAVRHYVKVEIIDSILGEREEVGVKVLAFVICGITGMGKGGAATCVRKDDRIKSSFDVVVWFDGLHLEVHFADSVVNGLKHELEEKKKMKDSNSGERKKFLVVLNNFQNENLEEWLKLKKKLNDVAVVSSKDGALLVTTLSFAVSVSVEKSFGIEEAVRFDWLDPDESEPLFEKIAGASWSSIEQETRDHLIEMCGGVLGAIETMARLVRSRKPTTEPEIYQLKVEFMQEMQLKYYSELDLHSWGLRQCFAYSLFIHSSEDSMKGEELVRLWMAEGFLGHSSSSSSSSQEPEDLGREYLKEFLRRSLFRLNENGEINISEWQVLARVVVGDESLRVEDNEGTNIDNCISRVLLSSDLDVSKDIPRAFFKTNKNVRTFLLQAEKRPPNLVMLSWLECDLILSAFKRLRVLTLKDLGMKLLPASIGDLKSLIYLNLSRNGFNKLPICIGELKHLQTLLLSHCLKLRELPNEVYHFPSLRHLDVDQCPNLMHMPSALKKLTCLRSLPHFVASNRNGLGELLHLNELRGELKISHLERFKLKGSRPAHAYLKQKQHLEGLELRWNHDDEDSEKEKHSFSVDYHDQILSQHQHLEPHPNLERLSIIGYQDNQFPGWLSSLNKLVDIFLYNCPKCQYLPIEDSVLANLKKLTLMSLDSLRYITETDKNNGCKELRLEQVKIRDCPNLMSWWKNPGTHNTPPTPTPTPPPPPPPTTDVVFSVLSELVVVDCPKLDSMPLFPNLDQKLVLDCSNMEPLLSTRRYNTDSLSKLTHLTIINVDEKQYPPQEEELLKNFTSLESLHIKDCKALKSIKGWKDLTALENLHIANCTDIDLPSEEWQGLKNLTNLVIEDMPNLESLPNGIEQLVHLDNLEIKSCPKLSTVSNDFGLHLQFAYIVIEDCPKLSSLPDHCANLLWLTIRHCPSLETWRQGKRKFPKSASGLGGPHQGAAQPNLMQQAEPSNEQ